MTYDIFILYYNNQFCGTPSQELPNWIQMDSTTDVHEISNAGGAASPKSPVISSAVLCSIRTKTDGSTQSYTKWALDFKTRSS